MIAAIGIRGTLYLATDFMNTDPSVQLAQHSSASADARAHRLSIFLVVPHPLLRHDAHSIMTNINDGNEVELIPKDDKVKVLLVDDDNEQGMLFGQVLEMSGYSVEIVANAEAAQARLAAEPFALLLADWDLGGGGMNGDALILWAKTHDPDMKTILFSNHPEVDEIAVACDADAAFRKVEGMIPLRQLVSSPASLRCRLTGGELVFRGLTSKLQVVTMLQVSYIKLA